MSTVFPPDDVRTGLPSVEPMQPQYVMFGGDAWARLNWLPPADDGTPRRAVMDVFVSLPWRGQGRGSELLRAVIAEADRHGIELWLCPASGRRTGGRGLLQSDLEDWYQRYGFRWDRNGAMIRTPG